MALHKTMSCIIFHLGYHMSTCVVNVFFLMDYKTSELCDRRWRKNAFKLVQYWIAFA